MGSLSAGLDFDVNPVQRSKEENQERAFVAASRRKDRSLDARLESANRASMLHKKRTGKALLITKEIVEKEAMYEEVDERYHEKRLKLLKVHTTELEEQFRRHLMAAMALNGANNAQQMARVSPHGGVQKTRHSVGSAHSSFSDIPPKQAVAPVSPKTTSEASPLSPVFDMNGAPSPSESSYVQTPASGCYMQSPLSCPSYVDPNTGLLTPSISRRTSTAQYDGQPQPVHFRPASITPPTPTVSYSSPVRNRFASMPNALVFQQQQQQQQQMATPVQQTVAYRASSEPSTELCGMPSAVVANQVESTTFPETFFPSPALSMSSMTNNSSHNSSMDGGLPAAEVQQISNMNDYKMPLLGGDFEYPDPDYNDFFNFATTMEDQWQVPMGGLPYDEFVNLDILDSELHHPDF